MATIKLKFRPSSVPEAEGTLYYQVIHKRKVKWISTEHHIYPDEWDENTEAIVVAAGSERKAILALIQCKIDWALKRWQTILDRMERSHKDYTVEECVCVLAGASDQERTDEATRHGSYIRKCLSTFQSIP